MGGRKKLTGAILQTSELEILSDPKHPDHEEIKEWMGDDLILLKGLRLGWHSLQISSITLSH